MQTWVQETKSPFITQFDRSTLEDVQGDFLSSMPKVERNKSEGDYSNYKHQRDLAPDVGSKLQIVRSIEFYSILMLLEILIRSKPTLSVPWSRPQCQLLAKFAMLATDAMSDVYSGRLLTFYPRRTKTFCSIQHKNYKNDQIVKTSSESNSL